MKFYIEDVARKSEFMDGLMEVKLFAIYHDWVKENENRTALDVWVFYHYLEVETRDTENELKGKSQDFDVFLGRMRTARGWVQIERTS